MGMEKRDGIVKCKPESVSTYLKEEEMVEEREYLLPNGDTLIVQSPIGREGGCHQEGHRLEEEMEEELDGMSEVGEADLAMKEQNFVKTDLQGLNVSKSICYTETVVGNRGTERDLERVVSTRLLPSSVKEIQPKSKDVSCQYCSYTTNRKSHLNEHYRIIHLKVKVICDLCGKEFSNINQHMRVVHKILRSGILSKKECYKCKKDFYDLTKHMAKAHNLKYVYDYFCIQCNTKFKSKFILQRHMQRKHGDKATCGECGKKVSNLVKSRCSHQESSPSGRN